MSFHPTGDFILVGTEHPTSEFVDINSRKSQNHLSIAILKILQFCINPGSYCSPVLYSTVISITEE